MPTDDVIYALEEYSQSTGVSLETLLALYLIVGEDIFFFFQLFQGQTVKFPKVKNLKKFFNQKVKFLELKSSRYKVGGKWKYTADLDVGDIIEVGNQEIAIVLPIRCILGHYYTILVE